VLLVLSACRYDTSSTLVRSSTAAAGTRVGDLVGDFMTAPPPALFLANAAADRAAGLLLSDMLMFKLSDQGEVLPSILRQQQHKKQQHPAQQQTAMRCRPAAMLGSNGLRRAKTRLKLSMSYC
jgi:hypothetical protein